MLQPVTVYGYQHSVYTRILRMVLEEKGVEYALIEVDPFGDHVPASYRRLHPFKRVPALVHDGFALYETAAITRYVDAGFDGPALTPGPARDAARMTQAIAIMDNYGYWPMVRQVFCSPGFSSPCPRGAE